jgi:16S rRNA (guanine(527)-N(7))-methyltransferase RsmG
MEEDAEKLTKELRKRGIEPAGERALVILGYLQSLSERRDWAGLTSRSLSEDATGAVLESLSVLAVVGPSAAKVVEVGSGGGILGVVLSVARPDWEVTLVESSGRKATFLAEAVGSLGLENTRVVAARAQGLAGSDYDICVSRAAGGLADISGVALPMLKPGGKYIALKQSDVAGEVESARSTVSTQGGKITAVIGSDQQPDLVPESVSLVVIEKL